MRVDGLVFGMPGNGRVISHDIVAPFGIGIVWEPSWQFIIDAEVDTFEDVINCGESRDLGDFFNHFSV